MESQDSDQPITLLAEVSPGFMNKLSRKNVAFLNHVKALIQLKTVQAVEDERTHPS